jgi:hypothetical protein
LPTAVEIRQATRLLVFPFLYFASVVPVAVGVIAVTVFLEEQIGLYMYPLEGSVRYYGYIALVASFLVVASTTFGMVNWGLYRLEGVSQLTLVDHLRRCSFLYVFVAILGAMFATELVENLVASSPMYEVPGIVLIWVIAGYAICVDALMFRWQRRRLGWSSFEVGS